MPIFGIIFGYVLGFLAYRIICSPEVTWKTIHSSPILKTIGIETGIQNMVVPALMFSLNFTCPLVLAELIAVCLSFSLCQFLVLFMIILAGKCCFQPDSSSSQIESLERNLVSDVSADVLETSDTQDEQDKLNLNAKEDEIVKVPLP